MPDDQNTTQNQDSTENASPVSPQEPTEPAPENTAHSEPSDAPLDALESSPNNFSAKSTDIPLSDSTLTEAEKESKTEEKQRENEPAPEPQPKADQPPAEIKPPETAPEAGTAQTPVSEPLGEQIEIETPEIKPESIKEETIKQSETKISEPKIITESKPIEKPESVETKSVPTPVLVSVSKKLLQKDLWKRFLAKVQIGKRKKLEKIMAMFLKKSKITNDEVEKFLHVSDATATRYLSQLEKENKIKQVGKTGKWVSYFKI